MTVMHDVPRRDFAELAAGYGSADAVARLRAGQHSKNLVQLLALLSDAPAQATALRAGFTLLDEVQSVDPEAVAALLTHPHVSAWAAQSVRVVRKKLTSAEPVATMLGHLAGVAASAALRAGVEFQITVPSRRGEVVLPGIGRAFVDTAGEVTISGGAGGLVIDGRPIEPAIPTDRWQPVHRLIAETDGLRLAVTLDDVDWHRDCHSLGATGRLDAAAVDQWRQQLTAAWSLLARDHRVYAEGIAAGLTTLVPLHGDMINRGVSATSMDAFGAVILSAPVDSASLAVSLVHEFQHAKLGALMDLVPILDCRDDERYYAPWRDDPRPLIGLLHGAYAFLGVADFWRVRRGHDDEHAGYAQFEFARWREQLIPVIDVLAGSGQLTPTGSELLDGMRATVEGWRSEHVPSGIAQLARDAVDDHRVSWRLRNLRCTSEPIDRLAQAWRSGQAAPTELATPVQPCHGERVFRQHARLHLAALRVTEPDRFKRLLDDPEALRAAVPEATDADLALARDEAATAVERYRRLIAIEPESYGHWAGLTLALRQQGDPAVGTLLRAPEIAIAVHRAVRARGGPAPDPVSLASWLAAAVTG